MRLQRAHERTDELSLRVSRAFVHGLGRRRDRLESAWSLVRSLGPQAVLARGYALVRDGSGALIRSVEQAKPGLALSVQVSDGSFDVSVTAGGEGPVPRPARAPRRDVPRSGQGDLF